MLHFCVPSLPAGHDEPSAEPAHFCEHTGCGTMSNVFVQTPDMHSVDVSVTVTHVAPNPEPVLAASFAGAGSPDVHDATIATAIARQTAILFMPRIVARSSRTLDNFMFV